MLVGLGVNAKQQVQPFSFTGRCLLKLVGWMCFFLVKVVVLWCRVSGFVVLEGREKVACG